MFLYCILTYYGGFYLHAYDSTNRNIPTAIFRNSITDSNDIKWTIQQYTGSSAVKICSYSKPNYCLGVIDGGSVQDFETIALQSASSANPTYWEYDSDSRNIKPNGHESYYLVVVDTERDYKPLQLWHGSPSGNYSHFRLEICNN